MVNCQWREVDRLWRSQFHMGSLLCGLTSSMHSHSRFMRPFRSNMRILRTMPVSKHSHSGRTSCSAIPASISVIFETEFSKTWSVGWDVVWDGVWRGGIGGVVRDELG